MKPKNCLQNITYFGPSCRLPYIVCVCGGKGGGWWSTFWEIKWKICRIYLFWRRVYNSQLLSFLGGGVGWGKHFGGKKWNISREHSSGTFLFFGGGGEEETLPPKQGSRTPWSCTSSPGMEDNPQLISTDGTWCQSTFPNRPIIYI